MPVVVQNKRKPSGYGVPAGGEILWYGIAANVPNQFVIDAYMANAFVRGAAVGGSSNTPVGATSHTHTNPANTGSVGDHTHAIGGYTTSGGDSSGNHYPINNGNYAGGGHNHDGGPGTSSSGGAHSHTLATTIAADYFPPYKRLYLIRATQETTFPVGGIIMFNGNIANRPLGTELCNGSGSTLDLRANFVYGASADGDVGVSGGAASHVHANANTGSAGSHAHTANTGTGGPSSNPNGASGYGGVTIAGSGHSHGWNPTLGTDAAHTHTVGNTDSASNIPSYVKLYFVMRTV